MAVARFDRGEEEEKNPGEEGGEEGGQGDKEGEGSEEEVEGEGGEEMQVGEGGDDEDYEKEAPPPSDIYDCDWAALRCSIHDIIN